MATVEYDLKELFAKMDERFNKLEAKIDRLAEKMDKQSEQITEIKVKIANMDKISEDLKELKTSVKNQIWAIISLFGLAVIGTLIRFVLDGLPKA